MRRWTLIAGLAVATIHLSGFAQTPAPAAPPLKDATTFQSGATFRPEIDTSADIAMVYGAGPSFAERAKTWRDQGYTIGMMTGISWGGYDDYFGSGDSWRKNEIQTVKSGKLLMHGDSTSVGYNVPSAAYIEYIKKYIDPAIDDGVVSINMEEPEFWADAGWSLSFQKEWMDFYGEAWQPPDSSVDAQYRASKLKYELYFRALKEVFAHVKRRAKELGRSIDCVVPTHSLLNYAQWRIVSPESHLVDIPEYDGYIAQVWTGTSRTPNSYKGKVKERTFEIAYMEYGQMLGMVRPTGRKVWFLHDPVEDNPNRTWADYKRNYECTLIASLMWPEVARYEIMPWPDRIFQGQYPKKDMDSKSGDREGIPADYATQLLACFNALADMNQPDIRREDATQGIGVIVSDTLMFQRANPDRGDPHFGQIYGLTMPLVKNGIPVEIVQLENVLQPECLKPYKVLLLTYEGQKPLKPMYHDALANWIRAGGVLVYVDDESDPYNNVREWWNDLGAIKTTPGAHLRVILNVPEAAAEKAQPAGNGWIRLLKTKPSALANSEDGADRLMAVVKEACDCAKLPLITRNYLKLQRGPYLIASVLEESVSDAPLNVTGNFVDILSANLPIVRTNDIKPGERILYYDLDTVKAKAKVVAAAGRVRDETLTETADGGTLTFSARGPLNTIGVARVLLPKAPKSVSCDPAAPELKHEWDESSRTVLLTFPNTASTIAMKVEY